MDKSAPQIDLSGFVPFCGSSGPGLNWRPLGNEPPDRRLSRLAAVRMSNNVQGFGLTVLLPRLIAVAKPVSATR
jgi:hypothetical protein